MNSDAAPHLNQRRRRAKFGVFACAAATLLTTGCSDDDVSGACELQDEWQATSFVDVTDDQGIPDASELRRRAMGGNNVVLGDVFRISVAPALTGTIGSADTEEAGGETSPVYVVVEDRAPGDATPGSMGVDWCVWTLRSDVDVEATLGLIRSEFPQAQP